MNYDCTIIGSGPGGYVAAIRCAQLGMKTALIEKYPQLGGTCLNVGCIPSKALLASSELYHLSKSTFKKHGINVENHSINWETMSKRKSKVVKDTVAGLDFLMKKNKITVHHGTGSFISPTDIQIRNDRGVATITSQNAIIATGSKPTNLPMIQIDKDRIINSTQALSMKEIPNSILILGAGVISLELGSVFMRLGTKVRVFELLDHILPGIDSDVSEVLFKNLKKDNMKFNFEHKIQRVTNTGYGVVAHFLDENNRPVEFYADYFLEAIGRRPYTEGLGLENIGVGLNHRGFIEVNEHLQTKAPNVYAIGDAIGGLMLAHKAEEEGVFVAELLDNQKPHIDYNCIPGAVYTAPEIATVGLSEIQLKEQNREYKVGKFPFIASGKAKAALETDGFVKVLADKETDQLLGVQIICARATDMIAEAVLAMEFGGCAEDIARICHPHPTFSEALKEAALAATENRAIHI